MLAEPGFSAFTYDLFTIGGYALYDELTGFGRDLARDELEA